jgi:hypothetical protein
MAEIKINSENSVEDSKPNGHRLIVWVFLLVIFGAGVLFYLNKQNNKINQPVQSGLSATSSMPQSDQQALLDAQAKKQEEIKKLLELNSAPQKVEEIAQLSLPANFPKTLPVETVPADQVLENKLETYFSGIIGVRKYLSFKTVDENYKIFKTYFSKNGWTVKEYEQNSSSAKQFFSGKNGQKATIAIQVDATSGKTKVAIIITDVKQ